MIHAGFIQLTEVVGEDTVMREALKRCSLY